MKLYMKITAPIIFGFLYGLSLISMALIFDILSYGFYFSKERKYKEKWEKSIDKAQYNIKLENIDEAQRQLDTADKYRPLYIKEKYNRLLKNID